MSCHVMSCLILKKIPFRPDAKAPNSSPLRTVTLNMKVSSPLELNCITVVQARQSSRWNIRVDQIDCDGGNLQVTVLSCYSPLFLNLHKTSSCLSRRQQDVVSISQSQVATFPVLTGRTEPTSGKSNATTSTGRPCSYQSVTFAGF